MSIADDIKSLRDLVHPRRDDLERLDRIANAIAERDRVIEECAAACERVTSGMMASDYAKSVRTLKSDVTSYRGLRGIQKGH